MRNILTLVKGTLLAGMFTVATGCIVAEPREGYWDRDHHRYYHEHGWHDCAEGDRYCR
jgi:hypothetical protein